MKRKSLIRLKHVCRSILGKVEIQSGRYSAVIYRDDTFLVSYPRSGSAWLRRLIASMQAPEADVNVKNINKYVPYVHSKEAGRMGRPRILKSHETYHPGYPRVLYLVRDGRDVAVSYYNYYQTLLGYKGSFADFLGDFLGGQVKYGSWHNHVGSWLSQKHRVPFMLASYEKLYEDPCGMLRVIADFIGLDSDEARIELALGKHTFTTLKSDIRNNSPLYEKGYSGGVKGGPGAWTENFDDSLLDLFWGQAGEMMERLGYGYDRAESGTSYAKHTCNFPLSMRFS